MQNAGLDGGTEVCREKPLEEVSLSECRKDISVDGLSLGRDARVCGMG